MGFVQIKSTHQIAFFTYVYAPFARSFAAKRTYESKSFLQLNPSFGRDKSHFAGLNHFVMKSTLSGVKTDLISPAQQISPVCNTDFTAFYAISFFQKIFQKSIDIYRKMCYYIQALERVQRNAGVAQPVEQLICNQQVGGSSPSTSSKDTTKVVSFFVPVQNNYAGRIHECTAGLS